MKAPWPGRHDMGPRSPPSTQITIPAACRVVAWAFQLLQNALRVPLLLITSACPPGASAARAR